MNVFLNSRNGTNLTNTIDATAHSIARFDFNDIPKYINDKFIPQTHISISEPTDVQIYELGNAIIQMYQFVGDINDEKVSGLEPINNYM